MSSKTKELNKRLIKENQHLRRERQQFVRTLAAIIRKEGDKTFTYTEAANVEEDDQIEVEFHRGTGTYTVRIAKGQEDDIQRMGGQSKITRLHGRAGDVESALPEELLIPTGGAVQVGDQHDPE